MLFLIYPDIIDSPLQDRANATVLMQAAADGEEEVVKLLIENGASIYIKDEYKRIVLDHAKIGKQH